MYVCMYVCIFMYVYNVCSFSLNQFMLRVLELTNCSSAGQRCGGLSFMTVFRHSAFSRFQSVIKTVAAESRKKVSFTMGSLQVPFFI